MRPDQQEAGYGEIWDVQIGKTTETRIIVCSTFYHHVAEDRVLMCDMPVPGASYALSSAALTVDGFGEIHVDRITTVYRHRLANRRGVIAPELGVHLSGMLKDMIGLP